jgi:intracellular sulfur oxidation DsrE/DsrF family protein
LARNLVVVVRQAGLGHVEAHDAQFGPSLQLLQGMGVRLVICGTCLEHFRLRAKVAVGEVGGMHDIVGLLTTAERVVTV